MYGRRRRGFRRTGRKRFRRGYNRTSGYYGRYNKRRRVGTLKIEKKFLDMQPSITGGIGTSGTFMANTGVVATTTTIVDIPQGTGESQRIGRKCTITNLHCKFILSFDGAAETNTTAATFTHDTVRCMIFWDKQCNGTAATAVDLLNADNWHSYRNLANSKRFNILYDKTRSYNCNALAYGDGATNASRQIHRDFHFSVNKKVFIPIEYSSTTGGLTEISSNNIGIIWWAALGGTKRLNIPTCQVRLRFIDY